MTIHAPPPGEVLGGPEDLAGLLAGERPMIDLRAPKEFADGAFPQSTSLPLMSDAERHQVGLCYRHQGQQAAIELGHELVSGSVRQQRIDAWLQQVRAQPKTVIYCWRGGLRSQITQQWLATAGAEVPRVAGGYKALRQAALALLENSFDASDSVCAPTTLLVIGGRTGTGKTELLQPLTAALDLEGIARHRGSAFGRTAIEQPTTIAFENALAGALCAHQRQRRHRLVVEDESRTIGRLALPKALFAAMTTAPVALVSAPMTERIERIYREYVVAALEDLRSRHDLAPHQTRLAQLRAALAQIRGRLGGVAHDAILGELRGAFATAQSAARASAHEGWIQRLLDDYYDRMYDYRLEQKQDRVVVRGSLTEVQEFAAAWAEPD